MDKDGNIENTRVTREEKRGQPEYIYEVLPWTVELITILNSLAECKIEFDRCRWERRGRRKDEKGECSLAQV